MNYIPHVDKDNTAEGFCAKCKVMHYITDFDKNGLCEKCHKKHVEWEAEEIKEVM